MVFFQSRCRPVMLWHCTECTSSYVLNTYVIFYGKFSNPTKAFRSCDPATFVSYSPLCFAALFLWEIVRLTKAVMPLHRWHPARWKALLAFSINILRKTSAIWRQPPCHVTWCLLFLTASFVLCHHFYGKLCVSQQAFRVMSPCGSKFMHCSAKVHQVLGIFKRFFYFVLLFSRQYFPLHFQFPPCHVTLWL